jgi:hypothetical protein
MQVGVRRDDGEPCRLFNNLLSRRYRYSIFFSRHNPTPSLPLKGREKGGVDLLRSGCQRKMILIFLSYSENIDLEWRTRVLKKDDVELTSNEHEYVIIPALFSG